MLRSFSATFSVNIAKNAEDIVTINILHVHVYCGHYMKTIRWNSYMYMYVITDFWIIHRLKYTKILILISLPWWYQGGPYPKLFVKPNNYFPIRKTINFMDQMLYAFNFVRVVSLVLFWIRSGHPMTFGVTPFLLLNICFQD